MTQPKLTLYRIFKKLLPVLNSRRNCWRGHPHRWELKFKVNCSSARLDDDSGEIFHSISVTPRSRPDISLPISFLRSRGGCSTEENGQNEIDF